MAAIPSDLQQPEAGLAEGAQPYSKAYTRYALNLLLVIYVINFLDRQVINILAEPIKHELHLADWQLGLMSGLGFMLLYTVAGIPIARLAERKSRVMIIAASVIVWSGFSALCGAAQSFSQLFLTRMGVGLGESGFTAPAFSLIGDYVPRNKRSSAMGFLYIGSALGSLAGLAFGGLVADAYGWRTAFLLAGAPGLLLGVLSALTLREPRDRKGPAAAQARRDAPKATFRETLSYMASKRTLWWLILALTIKSLVGLGSGPFTASFFLRNHTQQLAHLSATVGAALHYDLKPIGFFGVTYGVMHGICAVVGALIGGRIADRWGAKDGRAYVWIPGAASLFSVPLFIGALFVGDALGALALLGLSAVISASWYGPGYGAGLSVVPPHMRATCSAIILGIANLIGMGLGPLLVGGISDFVGGPMGLGSGQGVRWGLTVLHLFDVVAFGAFFLAARSIRKDIVG